MSRSIEFKPVSGTETARKTRRFSAKYPKQSMTRGELQKSLKSWQSRQSPPAVPAVREKKIKAVRFSARDIGKLRAISESPTPTAEAIVGQKMGPDQILGLLYSALLALEFTKMESEFKTRMSSAVTPTARTRVQSEWAQIVKAMQQAYAAGGLRGLKEADLRGLSQELRKNKANFNSIVSVANTGVVVERTSGQSLNGIKVATGGWVPQVGISIDPGDIVTTIPGLCDKPFFEGSFTKHFSKSFSLTVSLYVPCSIWNPFDWCKKNFTIASVNFNVDLQVGYRLTCCGAIAWGQASAEACGTILGFARCAGCTAKITGVAGLGRSGTGSNCTYGLGLNAELKCTFAGITVFYLQVPFGYTVNGPCPPVSFCDEILPA